MRRIDKLRVMTVEDVAKMIFDSACSYIDDCYGFCSRDCGLDYEDITDKDCLACVVKWLEEEEEKYEEK